MWLWVTTITSVAETKFLSAIINCNHMSLLPVKIQEVLKESYKEAQQEMDKLMVSKSFSLHIKYTEFVPCVH